MKTLWHIVLGLALGTILGSVITFSKVDDPELRRANELKRTLIYKYEEYRDSVEQNGDINTIAQQIDSIYALEL